MHTAFTHTYLMARSKRYAAAVDYTAALIDKARDDERGLTTTEVAILTFILVTVASGFGLIVWQAVKDRSEAIDDVELPQIGA